jgi:hypothetical protein
LHKAYRRALRAVLDTRRQLVPSGAPSRASAEQLDARLKRQVDRLSRTDRRLRNELYR